MATIFALSSLPGDKLPMPGFSFSDKFFHFAAYAALGAAIASRRILGARLAGPGATDAPAGTGDRMGIAVGALYGLSDEIHQVFVPLRTFSLADLAADVLGVAAGVALVGRLSPRFEPAASDAKPR